jgi:hypothetical protein
MGERCSMVGYRIPRLAVGGDEILGDQKPGNLPGHGHPKRPSDWVEPRMGQRWNVSLRPFIFAIGR